MRSSPEPRLRDRRDAGARLAAKLEPLREESPLVLGLPRGGVLVAYEVASRLRATLDVLIVRKLGVPGNPEYGFGAVAEDGSVWLDDPRRRAEGLNDPALAAVVKQERERVAERIALYRPVRPSVPRKGRTVIVVDDGAATGGTLAAALQLVRREGARKVVAALGVAPLDLTRRLAGATDELVVVLKPRQFYAVGQFYESFEEVDDAEVLDALRRGRARDAPP